MSLLLASVIPLLPSEACDNSSLSLSSLKLATEDLLPRSLLLTEKALPKSFNPGDKDGS